MEMSPNIAIMLYVIKKVEISLVLANAKIILAAVSNRATAWSTGLIQLLRSYVMFCHIHIQCTR